MDAHLVLELREQLRENRLLQEQQELKHQPMTYDIARPLALPDHRAHSLAHSNHVYALPPVDCATFAWRISVRIL